jgi:hypothetical protein
MPEKNDSSKNWPRLKAQIPDPCESISSSYKRGPEQCTKRGWRDALPFPVLATSGIGVFLSCLTSQDVSLQRNI